MDLNYTDINGIDIGVLKDYSFDLEFGLNATNDFELQLDLEDHCLIDDCRVYIQDTEYGGIVDNIEVDTGDDLVTYTGRTFHGILNSKTIDPDDGKTALLVSGDANDILDTLITRMELEELFCVSKEESGIYIDQYEFKYEAGYDGICTMLQMFGGKLSFNVDKNGKVVLFATAFTDYSLVEGFETTDTTFDIKRYYNPANHAICIGESDEKEYIIHLFTDQDGSILKYAKTEEPIEDSDYILDKSERLIEGLSEVTKRIDANPSSETAYKHVDKQPLDWSLKYESFYELTIDDEGESKYEEVEAIEETSYTALGTSKPSDWDTNYDSYFTRSSDLDENGQYTYNSVSGDTTYTYIKQKSRPDDWASNYRNYYYKVTDGIGGIEWKSAEGVSKEVYVYQTSKPSDWDSNFKNYYFKKLYSSTKKYTDPKKKSKGKQESEYIKKLKEKNTDYKQDHITRKQRDGTYGSFTIYYYKTKKYDSVESVNSKKAVAPGWKKNKYLTKVTSEKAPVWSNIYHTRKAAGTIAPDWENNIYFKQKVSKKTPKFNDNIYEQVIDHYAGLVQAGVEELTKQWSQDQITIDFADDDDDNYDIGDIVGACEHNTQIEVWQPITRKIVKIENEEITTIEYQIGGTA
jgi:hypothetical protein